MNGTKRPADPPQRSVSAASPSSSLPAPASSSAAGLQRGVGARPINTSSLTVYDSRTSQPHSAGIVGLGQPGLARSSSGTALSSLSLRVAPTSASPVSGSAAAAYALSAGLDASPSSSPLPHYSQTVNSVPSSAFSASLVPPPFDDSEGDVPAVVDCYENQRYYPVIGWSSRLLPTDRPAWSNEDGAQARQFTDYKCPIGWSWAEDWQIEKGGGSVDADGWQYASEFTKDWKGEPVRSGRHLVRRRRWVRRRQPNRGSAGTAGGASQQPQQQQQRAGSHLTIASASSPALLSSNSLTVGAAARGRQPLSTSSLTVQSRAAAPVSAITRMQSSPSTLSSLYSSGPGGERRSKRISAVVKVVEYQRYYPILGWKEQLLPTDNRHPWEDSTGARSEHRDSVQANPRPTGKRTSTGIAAGAGGGGGAPSPKKAEGAGGVDKEAGSAAAAGGTEAGDAAGGDAAAEEEGWQWLGEWRADITPSTDRDGWLYAVDFPHARWTGRKAVEHFIRKRVWVREKERDAPKRNGKQLLQQLFSKLERWEKDVQEEERQPDLIALKAATW